MGDPLMIILGVSWKFPMWESSCGLLGASQEMIFGLARRDNSTMTTMGKMQKAQQRRVLVERAYERLKREKDWQLVRCISNGSCSNKGTKSQRVERERGKSHSKPAEPPGKPQLTQCLVTQAYLAASSAVGGLVGLLGLLALLVSRPPFVACAPGDRQLITCRLCGPGQWLCTCAALCRPCFRYRRLLTGA